jgi:hypothetical protein
LYLGDGHVARDKDGYSAATPFLHPVAFGRPLLLATLIGALLFLWPLLAYGRPADFQDSASYYKGGRAAVGFVLDKIHAGPSAPASTTVLNAAGSPAANAATPPQHQPEQVRGARSVAYSIAAYVLGAPHAQMWLLIMAQALAAAFVCSVVLLLFGANVRGASWKLAGLALATPIAFVSCVIVPDIFAGLVICVIILLATAYGSLSRGVRMACVLIAAGGIAFHASHKPLALGLTVIAASWMFLNTRGRAPIPRQQWAFLCAPLLLGVAVSVALNFAAFGGASLTGKRYPLTLARSVAEGPGKWYLEKNCGHLKYAICEVYPHGVPGTIDSFLWGANGVKERATPEQMDRIRAEEADVVLAATRAYPFEELKRLGRNFARQLVLFQPGVGLDARIVLDQAQSPVLVPTQYDRTWVDLVGTLSIVGLIGALGFLFVRSRTIRILRPMMGFVFCGILLNDAICVYFSGVTDRYEARVIWLIPLLALAVLALGGKRGAAVPAESPA